MVLALWSCRIILGGTFTVAATLKIKDPSGFVADIGHYRIVPYVLSVALASYLPWLELVCAGAVLFRWRERGALLLLFGLCMLFISALVSAWSRGLDISCGCFGHTLSATIPIALARNTVLACLVAVLLRNSTEPLE